MATYYSESEVMDLLHNWVYAHYDNQAKAAKKLGTTGSYLSHVLNGRKQLTPKMLKTLGIEREVTVTYKKVSAKPKPKPKPKPKAKAKAKPKVRR